MLFLNCLIRFVFSVPFCKPVKRRRCVLQLTDFSVGETRSQLHPLMWRECDVEFKVLDKQSVSSSQTMQSFRGFEICSIMKTNYKAIYIIKSYTLRIR